MSLACYYIHDFPLAKANLQSRTDSKCGAQILFFEEAVEHPMSKEKWRIGAMSTMNLPLYGFINLSKIHLQLFTMLQSFDTHPLFYRRGGKGMESPMGLLKAYNLKDKIWLQNQDLSLMYLHSTSFSQKAIKGILKRTRQIGLDYSMVMPIVFLTVIVVSYVWMRIFSLCCILVLCNLGGRFCLLTTQSIVTSNMIFSLQEC